MASKDKQRPKVAVCMLGARMHYAIPVFFARSGILECFFTDNYIGNKKWLVFILGFLKKIYSPAFLLRWLGRRHADLPSSRVCSFEFFGFWYLRKRSKIYTDIEHQRLMLRVEPKFSKAVLAEGFGDADVVWGFDSEALGIFKSAKKMGKLCILEQAILPRPIWFSLMKSEFDRWGDIEKNSFILDEVDEILCHERQEWDLADVIVAGSDFVRNGLVQCGVDPAKVFTIPYGVNVSQFSVRKCDSVKSDGKIHILFVGSVGLRKGVLYLLEALRLMEPNSFVCKIAGGHAIRADFLERYNDVAEFVGLVPRSEMPDLYSWADVFVLPSIVEGSATVTYEALLSGVPVVCTPNAGSIVQDGINGQIVEPGSIGQIKDALERYINNPALLMKHKAAALACRSMASIERYQDDVLRLVDSASQENI